MTRTFWRMRNCGVVLAAVLIPQCTTAAPAQAFDDSKIVVSWVTQNAGNCVEIVHDAPNGYYTANDYGLNNGPCSIDDSTWEMDFALDQPGQNLWIDVTLGTPVKDRESLVSIYFGAYGEHLYLQDHNPPRLLRLP